MAVGSAQSAQAMASQQRAQAEADIAGTPQFIVDGEFVGESAQITIGVPSSMHIAALRDDFLEFCDHLNLDAIMDPMKF